MEKRTYLIVDDNAQTRNHYASYLESKEDTQFVKQAENGQRALDMLAQEMTDVIILDLIMPVMDGFTFLQTLFSKPLTRMPIVIVATALSRENLVEKAVSLGASYYMVKPLDLDGLYRSILTLSGADVERPVSASQDSAIVGRTLDEKLSSIFLSIGIPAHIKGYQFMRTAVKMVMEDISLINAITKALYPAIARKYSTSSSKVERAIRHAIEVAWSRGRIENINTMFGYQIYTHQEKPTNGEFIALIADKLSMEMAGQHPA